jgi:sarcosine oxidase delta subunit
MTFDVNGSASWRNKMIENWNHGRGVGRFFPLFSGRRGVSSSIGVVIRTGRNRREKKKDGWMNDR